MSSTNSELTVYNEDPRIPCRYGSKCYQKNSAHQSKYKHPPKNVKRKFHTKPESSKKVKLDKQIKKQKEAENYENNEKDSKKECISDSESDESTDPEKQENSEEQNTGENKKECISDSEEDESKQKVLSNEENTVKNISKDLGEDKPHLKKLQSTSDTEDAKLFIKEKFLLEMPQDFYDFWDYCKEIKPNNPCEALKDVGLKLIGVYDGLAGNFNNIIKKPEEYLRHWRYFYDPPELQTVIKGDDNTGYHIGYFFDSPDEPPAFLVSNQGTKNGILMKMGDNIFAAVGIYLEELKKTGDPFKKMHVGRMLTSLKNKAEKLNLNMSSHSEKIRRREIKVVSKTSNKVGLVVPYNKKTELGYRDLAMSSKELMILLTKLEKAAPEQKSKLLSDLQPVLTYANIALDECDFGTGVKLGWELIYHGIDSLDSTILQFLSNSYSYLKKDAFAKIAKAHFTNRKKGCKLSIL